MKSPHPTDSFGLSNGDAVNSPSVSASAGGIDTNDAFVELVREDEFDLDNPALLCCCETVR